MPMETRSILIIIGAVIAVTAFFMILQLQSGRADLAALEPMAEGDLAGFQVFEEPRPLPGHPLRNRNGEDIFLDQFGGELLLVNFWGTWCAPCRWEMPSLANLQNSLSDKPFRVVLVALDRQGFEVVDPFLEEVGVSHLTTFLDHTNRLTVDVNAPGLPTTILVSPDGEWIGLMPGPAEWDKPESLAFMQKALEIYGLAD